MSAQVHSASSTLMSGTPSTCTAQSGDPRRVPRDPAARRAVSPNTSPTASRSSAITIVPSGSSKPLGSAEPLAGLRDAQPELALDTVGVERAHRDPRLDHRDRERVVDDVAAPEPPGAQALEHRRLPGRAVLLGVDPDLAEEDAVGRGDRLAPHGSAPAAPCTTVREVTQPLSQLARAAAPGRGGFRAAAGRDPGTPRAARAPPSRADRELLLHVSRSRPRSRASGRPTASRRARRSSSSSSSSPSCTSRDAVRVGEERWWARLRCRRAGSPPRHGRTAIGKRQPCSSTSLRAFSLESRTSRPTKWTPGDPPPHTLDGVELRPAGPAPALEPDDDHQRPVEVVADPQHVAS